MAEKIEYETTVERFGFGSSWLALDKGCPKTGSSQGAHLCCVDGVESNFPDTAGPNDALLPGDRVRVTFSKYPFEGCVCSRAERGVSNAMDGVLFLLDIGEEEVDNWAGCCPEYPEVYWHAERIDR